jgi:type II secretory pathway pseudopilin PulG
MRRPGRDPKVRRGSALVVALVAVVLVGVLGGVLVRRGLEASRRAALAAREAQAEALLRSGLDRARARLAADPGYAGETWSPDGAALGGRGAGRVTITVGRADDSHRRATVLAEYPVGAAAPSRSRRELTFEVGRQARETSS